MNTDKIFFTSDTHFGHTRIIDYCSRPFPGGVEEMNDTLVKKWNEVVPKDGVVYHLGDFAFLGSGRYREIASSLHGRKILIVGNHDHRTLKKDVFQEIHEILRIKIDSQAIYLSHFPFRVWEGMKDGRVWNLHGHLHSGPKNIMGFSPYQLDVGVDGHDYRPWRWEEVEGLIKSKRT